MSKVINTRHVILIGFALALSSSVLANTGIFIQSPSAVPTCEQFLKENPEYTVCYPIIANIPSNKPNVNPHALVIKYSSQPNEWILYAGGHGIMAMMKKDATTVKISRAKVKDSRLVNVKKIYNGGLGINLIGLTCQIGMCNS